MNFTRVTVARNTTCGICGRTVDMHTALAEKWKVIIIDDHYWPKCPSHTVANETKKEI